MAALRAWVNRPDRPLFSWLVGALYRGTPVEALRSAALGEADQHDNGLWEDDDIVHGSVDLDRLPGKCCFGKLSVLLTSAIFYGRGLLPEPSRYPCGSFPATASYPGGPDTRQ